ncbi:glutaredoxin-1 [Nothobranchius furzeri]|uniref:Glutaredoxin-1 n=2 Tax=Nothobranchius TaxID=28779 RepID=A0A1A8A875_NOTFU|nr:transcript variant X1 [Nothobranchius furzeri]KAF7208275.1 transcript variant X2 [Nothobranchius furzeri]
MLKLHCSPPVAFGLLRPEFSYFFSEGAKMAQQFVKAEIKGDKVVVFLKPTCPYCVMAEDVLSNYNFKPGHLKCINISEHSEMNAIQDYLLELTGARTVPRVFIGENCIGGGSDVEALHKSGKLEGMLKSIGALQ